MSSNEQRDKSRRESAAGLGTLAKSDANSDAATAGEESSHTRFSKQHDISRWSNVFRSRLFEEFHIFENLSALRGDSGAATTCSPPQYTTNDLKDPELLKRIIKPTAENTRRMSMRAVLAELIGARRRFVFVSPDGANNSASADAVASAATTKLIKFKNFRRTRKQTYFDRRLTRVRNSSSFFLGPWAAWVLSSMAWEIAMFVVIFFNSISVGIETELNEVRHNYVNLFVALRIIDVASLFMFVAEIALRWLDSFSDYWKSGWNIFDFLVTVITAPPDISALISGSGLQDANAGLATMSQLRTLRILRVLRIATRIRSLRIIVTTTIEVFRVMFYSLVLLLLVIFIFMIAGMYLFQAMNQLAPSSMRYKTAFSSLKSSFETLFQVLTLDNWQDVQSDLSAIVNSALTNAYLILWVWVGAFIFKNIFVGVMVSNFERINTEIKDRDRMEQRKRRNKQLRKRLKKEIAQAETAFKGAVDTNAEPAAENASPSTEKRTVHMGSTAEIVAPKQPFKFYVQELSVDWQSTVRETAAALAERAEEWHWPRDQLFRYFQLMEQLQENMREHEELQQIAVNVLLDAHDD